MPMERSLILFKPDTVQRKLCGELLARIERKGLKLIGLKMLRVTPELSRQHYAEHVNKPFYPLLESFITSGPIVALAVQGPDAVKVMRTMMGSTNGRESAPGTIRGDYGTSRQMNLIHGSDGPDAAKREIATYFKDCEIVSAPTGLAPFLWAKEEE